MENFKLTDCHIHSNVSPDCAESMETMVQAATERGIATLCFTDHCDLIEFYDDKIGIGKPKPDAYARWARGYARIERVRQQYGKQIEILHGMELGEIIRDPERAREFSEKAENLDFMLGSVHALGNDDLYFLPYPNMEKCREITRLYLDDNIQLATLNIADSIAHIGFSNRYMMARAGLMVDIMDYEDQLREIFQIVIETGRSIELNTSGMRRNTRHPFPDFPALQLYAQMGGTRVTLGSDAHTPGDVGMHLGEAMAMMKEAGLPGVTVYRKRQPELLKF